jgi:hypothetical protein
MKNQSTYTKKSVAIILAFLLSVSVASAAWNAPTATPPGNNTPPPIHTGSEAQEKKGNLFIRGVDDTGAAYTNGFGVLNGNVGFGTFTPNNKLQVHNQGNVTSYAQFTNDTTTSGPNHGTIYGVDPSGHGYFWNYEPKNLFLGTNNLTRMVIDALGNIGVGTVNPTVKLDINTGTGGTPGVRVSAGTGTGSIRLVSGTDTTNNYPGYIDWLKGDGTRLSYLGYDSASNMNWRLENGANLQILGGNVELGGQIKIDGGIPGIGKVLTSDANGLASWQSPVAASCTQGTSGADVIDASGTWQVPAGVTSIKVKMWGAGGNGGVAPGLTTGGGGGGGGAYGEKLITIPAGTTSYPVVIGGPGGSTSFGGTLAVVNAGQNGQNGSSGGVGGVGGTVVGSGWLLSVNGTAGGNGTGTYNTGCSGNNFTQDGNGGAGGTSYTPSTSGVGGVEPICRVGAYTVPTNGTIGGGGGGAEDVTAGTGGAGKVIVEYTSTGTCTGGTTSTTGSTAGPTILGPLTDSSTDTHTQQVSFSLTVAAEVLVEVHANLGVPNSVSSTATLLVDGVAADKAYISDAAISGGGTYSVATLSKRINLTAGSHTLGLTFPSPGSLYFPAGDPQKRTYFYVYILTPGVNYSSGGSAGASIFGPLPVTFVNSSNAASGISSTFSLADAGNYLILIDTNSYCSNSAAGSTINFKIDGTLINTRNCGVASSYPGIITDYDFTAGSHTISYVGNNAVSSISSVGGGAVGSGTPDAHVYLIKKGAVGSGVISVSGGSCVSTQTDVTSQRTRGVVYRNTTGHTIFVNIVATKNTTAGGGFSVVTDNSPNPTTVVSGTSVLNSGWSFPASFMVLPNNYYEMNTYNNDMNVANWVETTMCSM